MVGMDARGSGRRRIGVGNHDSFARPKAKSSGRDLQTARVRPSERHSAVHDEGHARNVRPGIAGKEPDGPGDVARFAEALEGNPLQARIFDLLRFPIRIGDR